MLDLLSVEKSFLVPHIRKGGTAVDFTMGNGHDTLWLSRMVGADGQVFAFDIQAQALENTRALLQKEGAPENFTLILDSHHRVKEYVKAPVCVGIFNLGFLPGGDKTVTTKRETTLAAVRAGIELLAPDGALLIAVYPGHEEGHIEGELIQKELAAYERREFCAAEFQILNSPSSPYFFLVERR